MKDGFSQRLGRVVFHILLAISLTVLGTTSLTVRSAEAAPQVGSMPLAPHKPVQERVCSAPRCVSPQKLVCDRPDGCPGGCGVRCATAPVTPRVVELPKLTLSESEDEVTFDIRQIQGMLEKGEVLETELLTKDKKSYAGVLADFYALVDKLCHVATVSSDVAIAQQCPVGNKAVALQNWSSAITYLSGIAQGVRPDSKSATSYAAFVRSNPGAVYLIEKGRGVIPIMVKDLQGVMNGTVRMSKSLPIEFDGCSFPQKASGTQLSKVCAAALPIPPLRVVIKGDKLTLTRQTEAAVSVIVQISTRVNNAKKIGQVSTRAKNAKNAKPVATLPVHVQKKSSSSSSVSSSSKGSSSSSSVSSSSKSSSSSSSVSSSSKSSSSSSTSSVRSSSSSSSSSTSSSSSRSSTSSDAPSSYPSSDDSSSYYSSSSASDKIYACMCDGKDDAGRIVRAESRPPDTKAQCDALCPPSQRDKDGWCTKTDGFGTTYKVRNCKWELTDPPRD